MQVLLTGFGPFLDVAINPSGLIAERLGGVALPVPGDPVVVSRVLPVAFTEAADAVRASIAHFGPVAVLLVGVARGPEYRLETRAHATITSEHPDATGQVHAGTALGTDARHTSLDVVGLVSALEGQGHAVVASDDCGGYVCNSTYHAALGATHDALFLHIPPGTDEASLEQGVSLVRALLTLMVRASDKNMELK